MDPEQMDLSGEQATPIDLDKSMSDIESEPPVSINDHETIASKIMPDLGQEVEDFQVYHWRIKGWRGLEKRLNGPEFEAGGFNWKILLFPQGNNQADNVSIYLEFADSKGAPAGWHSCVQFALVMSNPNDPTVYEVHHAHHRFTAEESDWGFTRFYDVKRLHIPTEKRVRPLIEDDETVITAYVRVLKDPTGVLWHNFVNYDSKKETGFVGLKNQGATCYMNSLLQSLYCTNDFRRAVYEIPTETDEPTKSVALALQRVFYNLQFSDMPVGTTELTKSFGWDSLDAFMQHDVQEFNRVLQDNLEAKMKGTPADGAIKRLFVGKMKSYIKCINVDFESSRVEDYYDIQLNVKGCKNLYESFKEYVAEETLEGENKYQAEGHGLQDAKKGVIFESFPPVLHLQLKRFEYDIQRDAMVKINDRHEFPLEIDLAEFLSSTADRTKSHKYYLHGVLVHSGDLHGGHYFALLKPEKEGKWLKYDDDRVTPVTNREVLEDNYGGEAPNANLLMSLRPHMKAMKRFTNAYMLVYVRESDIDNVLMPMTTKDIPDHLKRRLDEEKALQDKRKREQKEMHLYITAKIVTDETFKTHQGFDLANFDEKNAQSEIPSFRVRKEETFAAFKQSVSEHFQIPVEKFRLWILVNRQNRTVRPDQPIPDSTDANSPMEIIRERLASNQMTLRLYLEVAEKPINGKLWPPEGMFANTYLMIFVKYFDPKTQTVEGCGKLYVQRNGKVGDIVTTLNEKKGFPPNTPLKLFEEIKPSMIEAMKTKSTFQQSEIQDGDIICFQKEISEKEANEYRSQGGAGTVTEFFEQVANRVITTFKSRHEKPGKEFELVLSKRMTYDQVASKVGEYLDADPLKIRFTTANPSSALPKAVVKRMPTATLAEMIQPTHGQVLHILFYEVLDISVSELETKKQLKLIWLGNTIKEEQPVDVLVPKTANMVELTKLMLEKGVKLSENGSKQVRFFEVVNSKISKEYALSDLIAGINDTYAMLYAEEIPLEELSMKDDERFIHVYHFQKDPLRAHGVPFKFLIKSGEPFRETQKRLQTRTGMNDKDWAKVKFAVVPSVSYTKAQVIDDEEIILSEHKFGSDDLLGLDHVDKSGKSGRLGGLERAIFIRG